MKTQKYALKTDNHLMQVESIAECSVGAFCNTYFLSINTGLLNSEHYARECEFGNLKKNTEKNKLLTCTKLPPVFKTFVLSIFEWPL